MTVPVFGPKEIALGAIVLIAAYTDIRWRKVFNWLTFPGMLAGLLWNLLAQGWTGLGAGTLGLLAGGLVFFPLFWWGGMGAGDIKLMAVIGAFQGWRFAVNTAWYAALLGGIIAVFYLLFTGELWNTLKHLGRFLMSLVIPTLAVEPLSRKKSLPYAVAIAGGLLSTFLFPPLL